jgi:hypothetical protein
MPRSKKVLARVVLIASVSITSIAAIAPFFFACVLGLCSLLLWIETRKFSSVLRIAGGTATGLMLGAIYWLPAALEAKYAFENISTLYPYGRSYLPRHAWPEAFWQALSAALGAQVILLAGSLCVLWYISRRRGRGVSGRPAGGSPSNEAGIAAKRTHREYAILAVMALVMTTSASAPIAKLLPKIELVAFAFRWLMMAGLFILLVTAAAADRLFSQPQLEMHKRYAAALLLTAAAALNAGVTIDCVMVWTAANPPLQVPNQLMEPNYTPKDGLRPESMPGVPQAALMLAGGGGAVKIERWDPQYRRIYEESSMQNALRLRSYYFPGWSAKLDGNAIPLRSDSSGIQMVDTPPGSHIIEVYMDDTPARILGKALSLAGLVIVILSASVLSRSRLDIRRNYKNR